MKRSESNQVEEHISELHNGCMAQHSLYEIYSLDVITVIIINIIIIGIGIGISVSAWCIRFILTMISYMLYVSQVSMYEICVCLEKGRAY